MNNQQLDKIKEEVFNLFVNGTRKDKELSIKLANSIDKAEQNEKLDSRRANTSTISSTRTKV